MTEKEIWKPIAGFEGFYEISNHGRLKSFVCGQGIRKTPRIMKPGQLYQRVTLSRPGQPQLGRFVHRLVLETFVGEAPFDHEATHLDGNPKNCRLDNLAWNTHLVNMRHKHDHGTMYQGTKHHLAKLTPKDILRMRRLSKVGVRLTSIKRQYPNISLSTVWGILKNRAWNHVKSPYE